MKAVVEYDGAGYAGFQLQATLPSIQGAIEEAVRGATGNNVRVSGAGRTDAGAHATGQVVSFRVDTRLEDDTLLRAVNAHLPPSVAFQSLETVEPSFDPRRQAVSREYHYLVMNRSTRSPLWQGRAHHVSRELDLDAMRRGAGHLTGMHDFSSFGSPPEDARTRNETARSGVRIIYAIDVARAGDLLRFKLRGSSFMQHMVRAIVGTLIMVGEGRIQADDVARILAARDRRRSGPPVPAHGLYLMKVNYEAQSS